MSSIFIYFLFEVDQKLLKTKKHPGNNLTFDFRSVATSSMYIRKIEALK